MKRSPNHYTNSQDWQDFLYKHECKEIAEKNPNVGSIKLSKPTSRGAKWMHRTAKGDVGYGDTRDLARSACKGSTFSVAPKTEAAANVA